MHIFIDKNLGGWWFAVALIRVLWIAGAFACGYALTLIFCLEVWRCVLFAGLFVWAADAG